MDLTTFTKSEIELLLQRARARQAFVESSQPSPNVGAFDFREAGGLSPDQIARVLELHAGFANRLGPSLTTLLGTDCKATAGTVEQASYGELVQQFPAGALFKVLHIPAPEGSVFLQADFGTVLPIVDLMLGGDGAAVETIRPLTGVDQEMFKLAAYSFGEHLQSVWAPLLETTLHFEHSGASANLFPAAEKVLAVKLEIEIGELRGTWTLFFSLLASSSLTRNFEQQLPQAESDASERNQQHLKDRLLDSHLNLELFLPSSSVSVRKLANLKVGQVVVLRQRSVDPIQLNVAGINLFQASPVSCGTRRGAQIKRTLSIVKSAEKVKQ